jgi:hypothetical protein
MNAHRHGVTPKKAAAIASAANPAASAKPIQIENHSLGRFAGWPISAMKAGNCNYASPSSFLTCESSCTRSNGLER